MLNMSNMLFVLGSWIVKCVVFGLCKSLLDLFLIDDLEIFWMF